MNKTIARTSAVNIAGTKFNMKHSLRSRTSGALRRAQRSSDRRGPHRQPASAPPAAAPQLHPGALPAETTAPSNTAPFQSFRKTLQKSVRLNNICPVPWDNYCNDLKNENHQEASRPASVWGKLSRSSPLLLCAQSILTSYAGLKKKQ